MFLIRTTLLVGLGVLFLPTDHEGQVRVYDRAKSAVGWTMTFCDRNPATCVQGRDAWAVFVKKAEFGAKMAFELIAERNKQPELPVQKPVARRADIGSSSPGNRGALRPADLQPSWRGGAARTGG
jgi:hypothetical protein